MAKEFIWCIAYINKVFLPTVVKDLVNSGFSNIKVNIPTVRVLRKKFKGKEYFDEVPLLFNYGFFRLPLAGACDKDYLMRLKVSVQGIYNWVYRPPFNAPGKSRTREFTSVESGEVLEREELVSQLLVYTIGIKEIVRLKRIALISSIYGADDISQLHKGNYIVLKGYPFDNIPAEVISVHPTKEKVKVKLLVGGNIGEAEVSFSNIFYSIYSDPDEPTPSDQTIEGLIEKYQVRSDKIYMEYE